MTYTDFLHSKAVEARDRGAVVDRESMNPCLFPHQRDIALWAIRGGSRAVFAAFGMGKTLIQIQIIKSVLDLHGGSGLIVCPLGVKAEFVRDALRFFDLTISYVRTDAEYLELSEAGQRFFVTNYERVRDGALDPNVFQVVSLDEASVLRSFGSKTYQTFLDLFDRVPFKFVCTATPSPNRFKELIHYAGFLGIMDTGQALTRFFKRDSSSAGNLQLHPHKEREFWLWISTWATFLNKPSDLGYSDDGYDLPALQVHRHRLPVDHGTAGFDSWGRKGWEQHVCPLQLDIVDRLIDRYSNPGELVLDPFGGLGTVAYRAVLKGRRGYSIELNDNYWRDSVSYCRSAELQVSQPTLFDFLEAA